VDVIDCHGASNPPHDMNCCHEAHQREEPIIGGLTAAQNTLACSRKLVATIPISPAKASSVKCSKGALPNRRAEISNQKHHFVVGIELFLKDPAATQPCIRYEASQMVEPLQVSGFRIFLAEKHSCARGVRRANPPEAWLRLDFQQK